MKRSITVRLSEDMVERLEATAERRGASKAALMEAALQRFLVTESDTADDATLLRRMSGQLEQLDRDLRIVTETVALHARYHLSITPPEVEAGAPHSGAEPYHDASAPIVLNGELESPAGVQEDASSDGFRGEAPNPNR